MTTKTTAIAYATAIVLLFGYLISYGIGVSEAYDLKSENKLLRERVQELEARPLTIELTREEPEGAAWQSVGECTITHYCGCVDCCGKSDCITATGTLATMGRTVSVDPSIIPLGSEVLINGQIFRAEDTGVSGNHIDLYIDGHEQALAMGVYKTEVAWR